MLYNNDFSHDLEIGQIGEKALGNILENKKVEVKTDFIAQRTGNVFVEYESRGKPSGIAKSQADYWCFVLSNHQIVLITSEKLKEIARKHLGKSVLGGDNNTSKGVLVPVKELLI